MAASDNEYPYTTQSVTGETPVPRGSEFSLQAALTQGRLKAELQTLPQDHLNYSFCAPAQPV